MSDNKSKMVVINIKNGKYIIVFSSTPNIWGDYSLGRSQAVLYRKQTVISIITWEWEIYGQYYPFNSYDNLKKAFKYMVDITIKEQSNTESILTLEDIWTFDVYQIPARTLNVLNGFPDKQFSF